MKKEILIAALLCFLLVLAEIFFVEHHEVHYFWQKIPGFFVVLGISISIVSIFFAKFLGKVFLYRKDNYYKEH